MKIHEESYYEVLMKFLVYASCQGTSKSQPTTVSNIEEQITDWINTDAPIGIQTLAKIAAFFDLEETK